MSRLVPPPGVAVEERDGVVYVARLPEGPILVLDGVAALVWTEACGTDAGGVAARVAERVDRTEDEIAEDVAVFVDRLVSEQLLQRVE